MIKVNDVVDVYDRRDGTLVMQKVAVLDAKDSEDKTIHMPVVLVTCPIVGRVWVPERCCVKAN